LLTTPATSSSGNGQPSVYGVHLFESQADTEAIAEKMGAMDEQEIQESCVLRLLVKSRTSGCQALSPFFNDFLFLAGPEGLGRKKFKI